MKILHTADCLIGKVMHKEELNEDIWQPSRNVKCTFTQLGREGYICMDNTLR